MNITRSDKISQLFSHKQSVMNNDISKLKKSLQLTENEHEEVLLTDNGFVKTSCINAATVSGPDAC